MSAAPPVFCGHRGSRLGRVAVLLGTPVLWLLALVPLPILRGEPNPQVAPPPMGWNSWNWHGKKDISEAIVRETIDAMVAQGLRDAGYVYVVVDGGWRDTQLGPNGELRSHPVRFPHGMKALADYAHARGLKFGLHTVPGTHDCGGDPVGGLGHEEVQLRQFVEWGLDFIKLDVCRLEGGWDEAKIHAVYSKWSGLLARCGRDMVFSISAYKFREWYPGMCRMARTTRDIRARSNSPAAAFDGPVQPGQFPNVMAVAETNNASASRAGQGYWNDPDMLVTGDQGLTPEEQKAHFALWCVMTAPLMLGNDPRVMKATEKEIVLNPECIAVDQDPTEQGRRIKTDGDTEIWLKKLADGRLAVVLLNRNATTAKSIAFGPDDGAPPGNWRVRDLFARRDLGTLETVLSEPTPARACRFLLLSRQTSP